MSKMSNINLELQEYANDLGYSTVQDALDDGYNAVQDLVTGEWSLQRVNMAQEQKLAHEAWLKEKEGLIKDLNKILELEKLVDRVMPEDEKIFDTGVINTLERAIKFIEGVKYE